MPFTAHTDLFFNFAYPSLLWGEGVMDPYLFMDEYYSRKDYIGFYGPLAYFIAGMWSGLVQWIVGSEYQIWMHEIIDTVGFFN